MKKTLLIVAAAVMVSGALITGCESKGEKVENAKSDVQVANQNLDQANEEYLAEIEAYRKETNDKILANDKALAEFKTRIALQKREARADYQAKIDELEHKNTDMKKQMDDYKADGKDKWITFKADFGKSMDGLGQSFKDLADRK